MRPHLRRVGTDAAAADAWYVAQALIAAEAVGTVQTTLEMSVQYAKERFTFGRAIGSYQALKHELTEVLRRLENARSLLFYAGWARDSGPDEFAAGRERRAVGRGRARWTSPRGPTSTSTAASARRGNTTPRCTSGAPS